MSSTNVTDYYIYLKVPPATCYERLLKRKRTEETLSPTCTIQWLTHLENLHEKWLNNCAYVIDGSQTEDVILHQALNYIKFILYSP